MRLAFPVGLLLASCSLIVGSVTPDSLEKTFLVAEIQLPEDGAQALAFARDLDGDGVIDEKDNVVLAIRQAVAFFGLDLEALLNDAITSGTLLLAFEIRSANFQNDDRAEISMFLGEIASGTPQLDGTDVLQVQNDPFGIEGLAGEIFPLEGTFSQGTLLTAPARIAFPSLPGFDSAVPLFLLLDHTVLQATVDTENGRLSDASLTGAVDALAFARSMELRAQRFNESIQARGLAFAKTQGISEVIPCDSDIACSDLLGVGSCTDRNGDANATGICLANDDPIFFFLPVLDDDGDGICEVDFDEENGAFLINELAEDFDLDEDGPTGNTGNLFQLDLDGDGVRDAMGLGLRLTAVSAISNR